MNTERLAEIQAFMEVALVHDGSLVDHGAMAKATPSMIAGNERLSPVEQLDIYREQFWFRHEGAMIEDFTSISHLLGDEAFHALCAAYFAAHPPDSFTLRDLGGKFPDFVAKTKPWAEDALVVDLARLEWAFVEAFDAADAPPLDTTKIATATEDDWARAKIVFHPAMQRVAMAHAADEYRRAVRKDECPDRPAAKPTYLVVYRGADTLQYIDIEPMAFALIERLAKGETLSAACEAVSGGENIEDKVGAWFQQWAAYGWIADVVF